MIRINLLEEQRGARKGAAIEAPLATPGGVPPILLYAAQVAIIGVAVAFVCFFWVIWQGQIRALDSDIEEARAEVERLRGVIELNEELQRQRAILKKKIEVIENLKRNQQLPVVMMDQLSHNLADLIWFDSLKVKGSRLSLLGKAQGEYAIASFWRNLEDSPYFKSLVPGKITKQGNLYNWSCTVSFSLPSGTETEPVQLSRFDEYDEPDDFPGDVD